MSKNAQTVHMSAVSIEITDEVSATVRGEVIEVDGVARVEGGFVVVTEAAGIVTIYPAHALARVVVTPF